MVYYSSIQCLTLQRRKNNLNTNKKFVSISAWLIFVTFTLIQTYTQLQFEHTYRSHCFSTIPYSRLTINHQHGENSASLIKIQSQTMVKCIGRFNLFCCFATMHIVWHAMYIRIRMNKKYTKTEEAEIKPFSNGNTRNRKSDCGESLIFSQ